MSETMASLMPIPISRLQTSVVAIESNLGAADPRLELRDGIHALLMRVGGDARDEVAVRLGVRGRVQRRFDLRIRRGGGVDGLERVVRHPEHASAGNTRLVVMRE